MSNIAIQRIQREFKEVVTDSEVTISRFITTWYKNIDYRILDCMIGMTKYHVRKRIILGGKYLLYNLRPPT